MIITHHYYLLYFAAYKLGIPSYIRVGLYYLFLNKYSLIFISYLFQIISLLDAAKLGTAMKH